MSKKILGLDIGSDAVTAALVVSGIKGARLEASLHLPLQQEDEMNAALDRCLETLRHSMDTAGAVCVVSVPPARVSFRNLYLPFKDERKIRQVLPFEIEPFLPAPVDDFVVDFKPLSGNGHQESTQLIAAAVDQAQIGGFLQVLSRHHLDPEIVTVGGYCETACLAKAPDLPGSWFYVSLRSRHATVCIADSGQVLMMRRLEGAFQKENACESVCRQIHHARLFCENLNHREIQPEVVYWTGEDVDERAWQAQVHSWFHCPAEKTEFLTHPDFKWAEASLPAPGEEKSGIDHALALALVELTGTKVLNFRRGPFALRKQWMEYKGPFLRTGAVLLLVLVLGFLQLFFEIRVLEREVGKLKEKSEQVFTSAFPDVARIVDPAQQMRVRLQELQRQLDLAGSPDREKLKIDLLQSLSNRIPAALAVEITRLVAGPDSMMISGTTGTFNAVDEIKSSLQGDPLFQSVTINSANLEKSGDRVNFKIRVEL